MNIVRRSLSVILWIIPILSNTVGYAQQLRVKPQPIDAVLSAAANTVLLKGPSVVMDENKMVWCGSTIKVHDSLYYMFYSTWSCGPDSLNFYDSWVLESEIALSSSKYPDRNFKHVKTILRGRRYEGDTTAWDAQMVHNPHIQQFKGKYYLYYIGSFDPGKQPEGSKGTKLSKRDRVQQMQQIGVIEFASFDELIKGNFKRPAVPLLSASTRVKKDNVINPSPAGTVAGADNMVVVNPSVVYRPSDKKYLLYFKGNWYDPVWRGVHGVAISDSPAGPFVVQKNIVFDVRTTDGKIASAEDPFVWYCKKYNLFFAVLKDFTGKITRGEASLALLQSKDGIEWKPAAYPEFMKKEVVLKNGSVIKLYHLERPFLLLDKEGMPEFFYGAACVESPGNKKVTGTFNVHIPLEVIDIKKSVIHKNKQ